MTNKEAIKGLKALSKEFSGYKPNEEMFNMAIEALEGKDNVPSNDTVSKASVCEILADIYPTDGEKVVAVKEVDKAYEAIQHLPSAQPKSYKEKLKEIADALSEKFSYMNTCLNERDIILGYLGVKRPSEIHCNTDCTNIKCESHYCYKKTLSAQSGIIHCKDCIYHNKDINQCDRQVCAVMYADDFCSYGERRGEQDE